MFKMIYESDNDTPIKMERLKRKIIDSDDESDDDTPIKMKRLKRKIIDSDDESDEDTPTKMKKFLLAYNEYTNITIETNKKLKLKKIRKANFPCEISENIARVAIKKHFQQDCIWNIKSGDLQMSGKKVEVKSFSSKGPTSFGPSEKWDFLCFVDSTEHKKLIFKVYFSKISNKSDIWQNIKVNKVQTYKNQCLQRRRPRLNFQSIMNQLKNSKKCLTKIFDGHIDDLLKIKTDI
jgi:hypothetical protein